MPLTSSRMRHVLLVEDDERSRLLITSMLERAGCEVTTVETSAAALSLFRPGAYDVVLLDLRLPDLDGGETAALFRQREKAAGVKPTPIIGPHGSGDEVQHSQIAKSAGLDDFLIHPIRQVDLMKTLNRHAPLQAAKNLPNQNLPPEGLSCIG